MKKLIVTVFVLLSVIFSLVACSAKEEYTVLEIGGYDYTSGADHNEEFTLTSEKKVEFKLLKDKKISYGGTEHEVSYEYTKTGYLYNSETERYAERDGLNYTEFEVNKETGRVDYYSWLDMEYLDNPDLVKKSREECLKIAREHLASYTNDPEMYKLVDETIREIPEVDAEYDFLFARMIDGVMTADMARIRVTIYGTVTHHAFGCFGEMRGAKFPDQEKMTAIQADIDQKLDDIYGSIKEDFSVTYELNKMIFERLADGRYALEYYYEVELTSQKNDNARPYYELTRLIVILENS